MHAVVIRVSIHDAENGEKELKEKVVPSVSGAPGFVAGYWTRSEDGSNGLSMLIFESEEAARTMSERVRDNAPDAVTLENVEVREVAASA